MQYQMKKSLRRTNGAKNYTEPDEEAEVQGGIQINQDRSEREPIQKSIFEHKNWSTKQKVKLMIFLDHYHSLPDWSSERRSIHLYKHLSTFLKKTRTPEQCKNIHSLLKRKFNTLEEVVHAMQSQLEEVENYQKLTNKYQKQIEKFQNQNHLFEGIIDQKRPFQMFRYKRQTEREELREGQIPSFSKIEQRKKQQQDLKINLSEYIKFQQVQVDSVFTAKRQQLIKDCNYYFKQWLKSIKLVELKQKIGQC